MIDKLSEEEKGRPDGQPPSERQLEALLAERGIRAVWEAGRAAFAFEAGSVAGELAKRLIAERDTWMGQAVEARGRLERAEASAYRVAVELLEGQESDGGTSVYLDAIEVLRDAAERRDGRSCVGRWADAALAQDGAPAACDHKFIDSTHCLKCGWVPPVSEPATREGSVGVASGLGSQLRVPPGFRVVVVATDESGAYVGVWRNTDEEDTQAILKSALYGADRRDHG